MVRISLLAAALLGWASGVQAAHIQSYGNTGTSSGSSVTFPSFTAIGTGDCVVGNVEYHNQSNTITSINVGGTASTLLDSSANGGAAYSVETFALCAISGGPTTITVNFSSAPTGTDHYLVFDEYSHQVNVDGHQATNASNVSTSIAPNITTSVNGDTVWTFCNPSTTPTTPSGFTARESDATNKQFSADEAQGTAGSITATWNYSAGAIVYAGIVGLTPAPCIPGSLATMGVGAC